MKKRNLEAFGLLVTGNYANQNEAEHALRDPFIEDWVERTGRFRVHQLDSMSIAPGVALGHLDIEPIGEGEFLITSNDPDHPLTARKAAAVAEALRLQDMFESIEIEPLAPPEA
jgi:hypothetical protein